MSSESYSRSDLQELENEIRFLSPRFRPLVYALIAAAVRQAADTLETAEINIEVISGDDLPSLQSIVDGAFAPGRRGITGSGDPVPAIAKVGGRVQIDFTPPES